MFSYVKAGGNHFTYIPYSWAALLASTHETDRQENETDDRYTKKTKRR
jgi:hypothetical protein